MNLFINIIKVLQNLLIEDIVKYFLEFSSTSLSQREPAEVESSKESLGFFPLDKILIFDRISSIISEVISIVLSIFIFPLLLAFSFLLFENGSFVFVFFLLLSLFLIFSLLFL